MSVRASMGHRLRILSGALLLAGAAVGVLATQLEAHAIHTTHMTVSVNADGLTLVVRAFADDLSLSVARHLSRTPPRDSSITADGVLRYATDRLSITDQRGAPLALISCGIERNGDAYRVCLRVATAHAPYSLRVHNQMLSELHADQVNLVQCTIGDSRRTTLFSRGRPASIIVLDGRCAER